MSSLSTPSISDVVDLLGELVAYPTESRSPNVDLIDHYANRAHRAGAELDVVPGEVGRANLHLRFGPDAPGGVLLSGHTDVVPAGTGWSTDPYALTEVGGRLAARGTADMKGFLATALVLLEETDLDALRAPVHLRLSYDEEIGCVGVRGLLDGEPTGMRLCNAHAGKVAYRIDLTAASGHSSRAGTEPTAVHEGAALVALVQGLNDPDRGISANVGSIHGGVAVNVLSPSCTLEFEVRHQADIDPDEVLAGVLEAVAEADCRLSAVGGHVTIESFIDYPGLETDPSLAQVAAMVDLVGCGAPGPVGFGTEGGLYSDRLGVPSVIVGPGDIADAHRPNETVAPDQLEQCGDVLRRTIHRFCSDDGPAAVGIAPVDHPS